jgi:hypothetical protein
VPQFLAKLDADVLLNFLNHCQSDTHNMNDRFCLIASDWAIRVGGNNSCMRKDVQGHAQPNPSPKHLLL